MKRTYVFAMAAACVLAISSLAGLGAGGGEEEHGGKVAYLGVATGPVNPVLGRHLKLQPGTGLAVEMVDPESAAGGAIQQDDVLVELDGQLLVNPEQFTTLVRLRKPGENIRVKLLREGASMDVAVQLGERERPPEQPQQPYDWRWDSDRMNRMLRQYWDSLRQWHGNWQSPWDDEGLWQDDGAGSASGDGGGIVSYSASATVQRDGLTATLNDDQGKRTFKVTDEDEKVLYDGPANTEDDLKKMPAKVRELYEEMSGSLKVKIGGEEDRPAKTPAKPKRDKPSRPDLRI